MRASSHKLAKALTRRLAEIIPPEFEVRAAGEEINLFVDGVLVGGSAAASILEDQDDRTLDERIETAVLAVLSTVQDDVTEYLTVQWPKGTDGEVGMPNARTDAERVYLWFEDSNEVAVTSLRPIELSDLMSEAV